MKIVNHRLVLADGSPVRFVPSPNVGGALDPRYLVMHYTAGRNAQESINWLCNPQSKASAHLVIARDGTITQLVSFNRVAWHAGKSTWQGIVGLNRCSIGIELDNPGPVKRGPNGRWRTFFGREYDDADITVGFHKLEKVTCGWVNYTPEQMDAALAASLAIVKEYGLEDVIRHEDISPDRKTDPGPAFPYASFRKQVMSGGQVSNRFITTTVLKIRSGPGLDQAPVAGSPLPKDTRVEVQEEKGEWRKVTVVDRVNQIDGLQGWVNARFLEQV
ncbi:MAG TPA: N-acetylmuramoyl-L-alanine amidase [Longimicrobiaceae bacterium]|nr:N-acetylmuramoyl-L-alanine amidase [Longimicrobiaceae bacterium]